MEGETLKETEAPKLAEASADSPSESAVVEDIQDPPRGETLQETEARKLTQARAQSPSEFAIVDDIIHDPRAVFGDRFNYDDDSTKDFKFIVQGEKDVFVHKELLCFFSVRMTKHLERNAQEGFLLQGTKSEEEMQDFLKVLYDGKEAARQLPRERFVQVVRNSIQYGYQFIEHNC